MRHLLYSIILISLVSTAVPKPFRHYPDASGERYTPLACGASATRLHVHRICLHAPYLGDRRYLSSSISTITQSGLLQYPGERRACTCMGARIRLTSAMLEWLYLICTAAHSGLLCYVRRGAHLSTSGCTEVQWKPTAPLREFPALMRLKESRRGRCLCLQLAENKEFREVWTNTVWIFVRISYSAQLQVSGYCQHSVRARSSF